MVNLVSYIGEIFSSWRRDAAGATAVEFVIVMPILLVTFAVIVEGSRIYWNYQTVVTGVRDASRFLARTINNDVDCTSTPASAVVATATGIVQASMDADRSTSLIDFPSGVALDSSNPVDVDFQCAFIVVNGNTVDTVTIVQVDANVVIQLPLAPLWSFFLPGAQNGEVRPREPITDQSRVYGI